MIATDIQLNIGGIQRALSRDLIKITLDLRYEEQDASVGAMGNGEPLCYNLMNNVNFDVLMTMDNFAGTVVADQANMQNDVNTRRGEGRAVFAKPRTLSWPGA